MSPICKLAILGISVDVSRSIKTRGEIISPPDVMGTHIVQIDFDPSALTRTRITFHEFDVMNTLEEAPPALLSIRLIQGYLVRSTTSRDGSATQASTLLLPKEWLRDDRTNNMVCGLATMSKKKREGRLPYCMGGPLSAERTGTTRVRRCRWLALETSHAVL